MENCELCEKPLVEKFTDDRRHYTCLDEWRNRMVRSLCTRCGKDPHSTKGLWCNNCGEDGAYKDYPGPSN